MNYSKMDKKIEKQKRKIKIKNQKIEQKEILKDNLPAVEPKGIKKFFKKIGIGLGIFTTAALAVFGTGKNSDESKSAPEDNSTRVESETTKDIVKDNEKATETLKEVGIEETTTEKETEKETEEIQTTIQEELKNLTNHTPSIPTRETGAENAIIVENQDYSIQTTTKNEGKETNKIEIVQEETEAKNETEIETEKNLKNDDITVNVGSTGGKVELEIDTNGENKISTDGTKGEINIEVIGENEEKNEEEHEMSENVNPFEDDYER